MKKQLRWPSTWYVSIIFKKIDCNQLIQKIKAVCGEELLTSTVHTFIYFFVILLQSEAKGINHLGYKDWNAILTQDKRAETQPNEIYQIRQIRRRTSRRRRPRRAD